MSFHVGINVHQLQIYVGGHSCKLISNSYMKVGAGSFVGLMGENGSGKSTLLRTLAEERKSADSFISYDFISTRESDEKFNFLPYYLGSIADAPGWVRVFDFLKIVFGCSRSDRDIQDSFQRSSLVKVEWLSQPVSTLSKGQRQRVCLFAALEMQATFILFDEPLLGLDFQAKNEFLLMLERLQKSQNLQGIIVTHEPEQFQFLIKSWYRIHEEKLEMLDSNGKWSISAST